MRKVRKVVAGVAAAAVALVGAAHAFGALTPKLVVSTSEATNTTTVNYEQGAADDTLARITVFMPTTVFAPAAQTSGDPVGTASLTTSGGVLSGSITAMTGAESITYDGRTTTLSAAWIACLGAPQPGPVNSSNYWVISTTGTAPLQIPIFFSSINQDQPFGDSFLAQLNVCFPESLKVSKLGLTLVDSVSTSPGWSVWHVRAIPYAAARQNPAGGAEAEGQDRLPWEVTVKARALKARTAAQRGRVTVSGRVSQGSRGVSGVTVRVLAGKKVIGTVKSKAGGNYSVVLRTSARALTARAAGGVRMLPACVEPKLAPLPCRSSTISGFDVTSEAATVAR